MSRRGLWVGVSVAVTFTLLCCGVGGTVAVTGLFAKQDSPALNPAACGGALPKYGHLPAVSGYSQVQRSRAYSIIRAGVAMHIPPRGWIVAIATALQESSLQVYANDNPTYPVVVAHSMALPHDSVGHDHDSVGLFQQRPSPPEGEGGWGTVKQLMDPETSARKFYSALKGIHGWQQLPVTVAAQQVQNSAFPDAYAKWEDDAAALVNALANGAARAGLTATAPPGASDCAPAGEPAASGWIRPVKGPISSPFGPRGGVLHNGVDLAPPKGTPIVAAAGGLVITSTCEPSTGNCDVDGSISTPGCGWYVEIRHSGGVNTRYCHMIRRPEVHVGQTVKVGQTIGYVGQSGNADGPHLHFEVHLHNDMSPNGAIDPVPFMREKGAPVGT